MSGLRIRSVKFKNGGEIRVLPAYHCNFKRIDLGWGEVVCRDYDNKSMSRADVNYILEAAKHVNMTREEE